MNKLHKKVFMIHITFKQSLSLVVKKKLVSIRHQHFELFMVEREFVPTKSTSLNGFKGHVVVTMLHLSPTKTPLVVLHLDRDFCVQVNKIGFQEK